MESEESLLITCKSLPPHLKDPDVLQDRINPYIGSVSSTQGEMDQGITGPAKNIIDNGLVTQEDRTASPQTNPEAARTVRKEGPLNLLDLPLVILKDIFKEVSAIGRTL